MKKPTKDIVQAKELRKFLRSKHGFGNKVCEEMVMGCGNCLGQTLIGFLNYYIDVAESPNNPKRKGR